MPVRRYLSTGLLSTRLLAGIASLALVGLCIAAPERPAEQQEYWARFDGQDWSAAITAAEGLVNIARADAGNPLRLGETLTLLGNAQLGAKNLPAAEAAYREALDIIGTRQSAGNEKLLAPLRGLGYTLAAGGRHAEAIPLLQRALTISRRNFGLFDLGQQGLLRQLATSLTVVNDPAEAEKHMQYLLRVGERAYGARDLRMAPLYCILGDWYTNLGVLPQARDYYRQALAIAERQAGENDMAVVDPLRALAASYRRELYLSGAGLLRAPESDPSSSETLARESRPITALYLNSEGERALLRAVKVVEAYAAANPDKDKQPLIATLIDTGDWYQTRSQPQKAFEFYRRAASLVPAAAADSAAAAAGPFAFPVQVYLSMPLLATRNRFRPNSDVVERFVQVEFTVTSDGSVRDERVIDQDAGSRSAAETLNAIHTARYRPKFVAGEPVETTTVRYRQVFRQRRDRDAEDKEAAS